MNLNLTDEQVETVIKALDYYAHMEAGQTQAPDLCDAEDYDESDLARDIEARLAKSRHLRDQWVLNPQDGVKYPIKELQ